MLASATLCIHELGVKLCQPLHGCVFRWASMPTAECAAVPAAAQQHPRPPRPVHASMLRYVYMCTTDWSGEPERPTWHDGKQCGPRSTAEPVDTLRGMGQTCVPSFAMMRRELCGWVDGKALCEDVIRQGCCTWWCGLSSSVLIAAESLDRDSE